MVTGGGRVSGPHAGGARRPGGVRTPQQRLRHPPRPGHPLWTRGQLRSPVFACESGVGDLIGLIAELTGFEGEIRWDATKPDGQPRRVLKTSGAAEAFAFRARTTFEDRRRRAVDAYLAARITVS